MSSPPPTGSAHELRDLLLVHCALFALGGALLWSGVTSQGIALLAFGLAYVVVLPLAGRRLGHRSWVEAWAFLLPLSVAQILPDAFLSAELGVLVFPDLGVPKIATVSAFMATLWLPPLFLCVWLGRRLERRGAGVWTILAAVGALSLALFAAAEATLTLVPVWFAQGVVHVGPVALYVLPAEAALGPAAWLAERLSRGHGLAARCAAACVVMVFYLGGLCLGLMLLEPLLL